VGFQELPDARRCHRRNLVKAFTDNIINPLIAAAQGGVKGPGLGWQLVNGGGDGMNLGGFISAIIYFIIFMAVVYIS
jgi:large conductance mechanosensitive channel